MLYVVLSLTLYLDLNLKLTLIRDPYHYPQSEPDYETCPNP